MKAIYSVGLFPSLFWLSQPLVCCNMQNLSYFMVYMRLEGLVSLGTDVGVHVDQPFSNGPGMPKFTRLHSAGFCRPHTTSLSVLFTNTKQSESPVSQSQ